MTAIILAFLLVTPLGLLEMRYLTREPTKEKERTPSQELQEKRRRAAEKSRRIAEEKRIARKEELRRRHTKRPDETFFEAVKRANAEQRAERGGK